MKTCPKCGELNGNGRTRCYKCGSVIGAGTYKKICRKCGLTFPANETMCPECRGSLSVYDPSSCPVSDETDKSDKPNILLRIIAVLIPIIGFAFAIIYLCGDQKGKSKVIAGISAAAFIVYFCLMMFFK